MGVSKLLRANIIRPDFALLVLVMLCALAFRRYDAFLNPQLWAEDGPVFLQQFYEKGFATLITPYAGYLNTIERLIVLFWGVLHVNLLYVPLLYVATSVLLYLFVAVAVWSSARQSGYKNPVIYATFFLFAPLTSDVFMNITNLNGILSLYLVNFLYMGRKVTNIGKARSVIRLLAIAIFSLSGPTSILLIPVVVGIIFFERKNLTLKQLTPLILMLLAGALQLLSVAFVDKGFYRGIEGATEKAHLLKFFLHNVGDLLFMQYGIWPPMSPLATLVVCLLVLIVLLVLYIRAFMSISSGGRFVLLATTLLYFASVVKAYWPHESELYAMRNASRYFVVPYTCIGWLFLTAIDKKVARHHVALYLLFFVLQSRYIKFELADQNWDEQIHQYYKGEKQIIDINPAGWKFGLPVYRKD